MSACTPPVVPPFRGGSGRAEHWLQPEPDTKFSAMLHDALTWIAPALRAADR